MKIMRAFSKPVRVRMALNSLNKIRHSDSRKASLKQRSSDLLLSNLLKKRGDLLMDEANKSNSLDAKSILNKNTNRFLAKHDKECSRELDLHSKAAVSTKKKRQMLRSFFEVLKKA